jgi:regulator of protease activity HflC (stomatin/prohibitin superfamily)
MPVLKMVMIVAGVALGTAGATEGFVRGRRRLGGLLRDPLALVLGVVLLAASAGVASVPQGFAAIRVSEVSGVRPGVLGPGLHFVTPLLERLVLYDVRERVVSFAAREDGKPKTEILGAQTKEGLRIGLSVSVRFRLDPGRLADTRLNAPPVPDEELVSAAVANEFREVLPNYLVREIFATKREEIREKAREALTLSLARDGIVVKDVMLRDVELPVEYARGLEGLLVKEQENERMVYELQVKEKQVRQAELEAEARKVQTIKGAEAEAAKRVLEAKAEADAMQHTLPLKEKQVQQSRLEALARKEATISAAEAQAQTRLIEGRAEVEHSRLMADANANSIRVTSAADAERLEREGVIVRENPLLIQKIVAERLSDKMQIMMVPSDGHNFFANEIFKSAAAPLMEAASGHPPDPRPSPSPRKTAQRP